MKIALLFVGLSIFAHAQSDLHNSFVFSGGTAIPAKGYYDTGVSLGATYGYRVLPFLQLEAGFMTASQLIPEIRGANYDVKPDDRQIWVPFGVRGILPVRNRVELSAVAGGLYEHSSGFAAPYGNVNSTGGWGWHAGAGTAVALDHGHHFWIGGSSRFFFANTNHGFTHERWFIISGDLGVRF
jgi:hypothetical protein